MKLLRCCFATEKGLQTRNCGIFPEPSNGCVQRFKVQGCGSGFVFRRELDPDKSYDIVYYIDLYIEIKQSFKVEIFCSRVGSVSTQPGSVSLGSTFVRRYRSCVYGYLFQSDYLLKGWFLFASPDPNSKILFESMYSFLRKVI